MRAHQSVVFLSLLMAAAAPAGVIGGGPSTIRPMGSVSGFPFPVQGRAINDSGDTAGYRRLGNGIITVRDVNGVASMIPNAFGGISSSAEGINNSGDLVGYANDTNGQYRAYLYHNGAMTDLGALPGATNRDRQAFAINNGGQAVGYAVNAGGLGRAVRFSGGQAIDLGTLGGTNSIAYDVNEAGTVVGHARVASEDSHAFVYQSGTMHDLGTLGGPVAGAEAINNAGQVVGYSSLAPGGTARAALWSAGFVTALGTLPGGQTSIASDINDYGVAVGFSHNAASQARAVAFFDGQVIDLNLLLPGASGWTLTQAFAINNAGMVTGAGVYLGETVGFVMTGVPAPAPLAVLGMGVATLLSRRRSAAPRTNAAS